MSVCDRESDRGVRRRRQCRCSCGVVGLSVSYGVRRARVGGLMWQAILETEFLVRFFGNGPHTAEMFQNMFERVFIDCHKVRFQ